MNLDKIKTKTYKYKTLADEAVGAVRKTFNKGVGKVMSNIYGFILFVSFIYMINFAFTIYILRYL